MAVSLCGIGAIAGVPMAGLPGFFNIISTVFSVESKSLNKKIAEHEKTISINEAKHLSVTRLFSKITSGIHYLMGVREVENSSQVYSTQRVKNRLKLTASTTGFYFEISQIHLLEILAV